MPPGAVKKNSTADSTSSMTLDDLMKMFLEQKAENAELKRRLAKVETKYTAEREELVNQITNLTKIVSTLGNEQTDLKQSVGNLRGAVQTLQFRFPEDVSMPRSMQNSVHGPVGAAATPEVSRYASAQAAPPTPATPCSGAAGLSFAAVVGGGVAAAAPAPNAAQQQHAPGGSQAPTDPTAQGLDVLLQTYDAQQAKEFKNDPARTTAIAVQNLLRQLTGVRVAVAGARVLPPGKPRAGTAAGSGVRVLVTLHTLTDKLNVMEHRKQLQQWHVRRWRTEDEQRLYVQLLKDHSKGLAEAKAAGRWARPTLDYKKMRVQVDGQWIDMQPDSQRAAGAGAGGGGVATPAATPAGGEQ